MHCSTSVILLPLKNLRFFLADGEIFSGTGMSLTAATAADC